jgi:hypothetical protein
MSLTFATLRFANALRLPQFKNSHGGPAHDTEDGSDWSPAQWFQAVVGEMGEFAMVRLSYEMGLITFEDYAPLAAKELADIATYLDILARRALDKVPDATAQTLSGAQTLMSITATLGEFANMRKKYDRGDHNEREYLEMKRPMMEALGAKLHQLALMDGLELGDNPRKHPSDAVVKPNADGVDLGEAVRLKFNEVSDRIAVKVHIDEKGQVTSL